METDDQGDDVLGEWFWAAELGDLVSLLAPVVLLIPSLGLPRDAP